MKHVLRWLIFWISLPFGGEFSATSGTWKFRFLNWLYEGEGEPEFDVQWPEEKEEE